MYYAHTAPTAFGGVADELAQGFTCFVTAQAMQIDLPLQTPMPFAQFLGDVSADALAAITQLIVGIEQGGHIEVVAQAFAQHIDVIQALLLGQRLGRLRRQTHPGCMV